MPPGTYPVVHSYTDMYQANVGVELTDATCANLPATSDATGGTVTLDTVTSMMVTGRFDLTFPSGDHLTGQFAAPVCNFDLNALVQNGLTGCGSADGGTD